MLVFDAVRMRLVEIGEAAKSIDADLLVEGAVQMKHDLAIEKEKHRDVLDAIERLSA